MEGTKECIIYLKYDIVDVSKTQAENTVLPYFKRVLYDRVWFTLNLFTLMHYGHILTHQACLHKLLSYNDSKKCFNYYILVWYLPLRVEEEEYGDIREQWLYNSNAIKAESTMYFTIFLCSAYVITK